MNQGKYGFVYIWRDKKRKMNYIGCHWGFEDDGYICSSAQMRNAQRRRPLDFRRKILQRIYTNRLDLLEVEYQWLQLIPDDELGVFYYNQRNKHFGHWTATESKEEISQKISIGTKLTMNAPEMKEKMRKIYDARKGVARPKESVEKSRQSCKETWDYKREQGLIVPPTDEIRKRMSNSHKGKHHTEETRLRMSEATKNRDDEYRQNMSRSVKLAFKEGRLSGAEQGKRSKQYYENHPEAREQLSRLTSSWKWWNNGAINKRCTECPEGFKSGRIGWAAR